jgi:hypothetical protein
MIFKFTDRSVHLPPRARLRGIGRVSRGEIGGIASRTSDSY